MRRRGINKEVLTYFKVTFQHKQTQGSPSALMACIEAKNCISGRKSAKLFTSCESANLDKTSYTYIVPTQ
jgi:hypothetical protein